MSAFKDWLNGLTGKTTPVDADELYVRDSSGTPSSKKLTWANLKTTLLEYFDTAYLKLSGGTLAGGTVTTSSPVLTTTQTWNDAGVTFTGKVTNITSTASAAASLIEDWQVGSTSMASLSKAGVLTISGGVPNSRIEINGGNTTTPIGLYVSGTLAARLASGSLQFGAPGSAFDTQLHRDAAANILAQRNGTNAQTKRLYGTYTDASNYRRVALAMTTAGVATLAPEGAGTGASGNVLHISGLPTSNPGPGILWNDSNTVKVGT